MLITLTAGAGLFSLAVINGARHEILNPDALARPEMMYGAVMRDRHLATAIPETVLCKNISYLRRFVAL